MTEPRPRRLAAKVLAELRTAVPATAVATIVAITDEVADYGPAHIDVATTRIIGASVELALRGFLDLVAVGPETPSASPARPALDDAYSLGRGEALAGRSMDALLAAYRVGARVAWEQQAALMLQRRVPAGTVASLAALTFTYIDELSAASAAGHRDQIATTGRVREQQLERLATALLAAAPHDDLVAFAERAGWPLPDTLTVVLAPTAQLSQIVLLLGSRTLRVDGGLIDALADADATVLLVADAASDRRPLLHLLRDRGAIVGPCRPWSHAHESFRRVLRARDVVSAPAGTTIDTEDHLVTLTLTADPAALDDLRRHALAPLAALRPETADRLARTLRAWLVHQGRRSMVADELHVHPQTIRYRMSQLERLFGARLVEPGTVTELIVALATWPDAEWGG